MYLQRNTKKYLFCFCLIFWAVLFFYYLILWSLCKNKIFLSYNNVSFKTEQYSQENKKNLFSHFPTAENKKIIKNKQDELQTIFSTSHELKYELKRHNFKKGQPLYAFLLDIKFNFHPFQEGIVSEEFKIINDDDQKINVNLPLAVSIKGKNNKIFFNTDGDFVGFSLPVQDDTTGINYVLTSNMILDFFKWRDEHYDFNNKDNREKYKKQIQDLKTEGKYYLDFILPDSKETDTVFFNNQGFFIGFYIPQKNIINQLDQPILLDMYESMLQKPQPSNIEKKNNIPSEFSEISKDLSEMTFYIEIGDYSGSGFIYNAEKLKFSDRLLKLLEYYFTKTQNSKEIQNQYYYKYYVLTNRHVIDETYKSNHNATIKLRNKYFQDQNIEAELLGYIQNNNEYDDLAILVFSDLNENKFQKIQENINKYVPKEKETITLNQGTPIYSMGSQKSFFGLPNGIFDANNALQKLSPNRLASLTALNLLKKGHIVFLNDKEINFDIQIDHGNSGGPVFNQEGKIVGINRSVFESSIMPDKFSTAIHMHHIQDFLKKIKNLKEKKIFIDKDIYYQNNIQDLLNYNFFVDKNNFSIFIKDLKTLAKKNNEIQSWKSYIAPDNSHINVRFVQNYDRQQQIFTLYPQEKLQIKIKLDENSDSYLFFINKLNVHDELIESRELSQLVYEDLKDDNFLALEYIDKKKQKTNSPEKSIHLDKIKNSLIIWNNPTTHTSGQGVLYNKQTLTQDKNKKKYLYHVFSTYHYDNNNQYFNNVFKPIFNFFHDKIDIIICYQGEYFQEKGYLKSFYQGPNNIAKLTFESNQDYESILKQRDLKNIDLGEDIYTIINTRGDNYFPQMFKSNVGSKNVEQNQFIFDSVFDLNHKKEKLNFLCFDSLGNFLGFNYSITNKNKLISHFIKAFSLDESILKNLFAQEYVKKNFFTFYNLFFILIVSFIMIIIFPNKKNMLGDNIHLSI